MWKEEKDMSEQAYLAWLGVGVSLLLIDGAARLIVVPDTTKGILRILRLGFSLSMFMVALLIFLGQRSIK
jgi:hypothetical protein